MVKHFTIAAALGLQTIKAAVRSDTVDEMVADWGKHLKADDPEKRRSDTSAVVVTSLNDGTHHTHPEGARAIASALVWAPLASCFMPEHHSDALRGLSHVELYSRRSFTGKPRSIFARPSEGRP